MTLKFENKNQKLFKKNTIKIEKKNTDYRINIKWWKMKNETSKKTIERRWRLLSYQLRNPNGIETCV